jgi:GxxExxY protein
VLGAGFLEAVYANALTVELRRRGVAVDRNVAFEVVYRGVSVGRYVADFVVGRRVIVETKWPSPSTRFIARRSRTTCARQVSKWASS